MRGHLVVEYVGIERGEVQQVMCRSCADGEHAETRQQVRDLDGRPYVMAHGTRRYLDEEEARAARQAREAPYMRIPAGTYEE